MKTTIKANSGRRQSVKVDPALNKYANEAVFPKKLALAKEQIEKSNLVEFLKQRGLIS